MACFWFLAWPLLKAHKSLVYEANIELEQPGQSRCISLNMLPENSSINNIIEHVLELITKNQWPFVGLELTQTLTFVLELRYFSLLRFRKVSRIVFQDEQVCTKARFRLNPGEGLTLRLDL